METRQMYSLRRHRRVPARIPVRISVAGWSLDTVTSDVSLSGVFALVPLFPVDAHVVTLRLFLPDSLEYLTLTARAARVVTESMATSYAPAGVGFEIDKATHPAELARWREFITRVEAMVPWPGEFEVEEATSLVVEQTVRFNDIGELRDLQEIDLFMGGMFLELDVELSPGMDVLLELVHPMDGSSFRLRARVTRRIIRERRGVCVAFRGDLRKLGEQLQKFILDGMPKVGVRATQELFPLRSIAV